MQKIKSLFILLTAIILVMLNTTSTICGQPGKLTGLNVAKMVYNIDDGEDSHFLIVMTLIDKNGSEKTRTMETWNKEYGKLEKGLIRFTVPASIEGTGFLNIEKEGKDDDQHLFLPSLRRSRRIVSSQRDGKFVNTDFTFEDMERRRPEKDNHKIKKSELCLGKDCWVLVSAPKPGTNSQYSKMVSWVDKESHLPLRIEFFDKKKRHCKSFEIKAQKKINGIWTAMDIEMKDLLSKHATEMNTLKAEYNIGLSDDIFSKRYLEKY